MSRPVCLDTFACGGWAGVGYEDAGYEDAGDLGGRMTFPQLPPHDIQAEASVLASLLVDPGAFAKVQPIVSAADFYREHHGWVFEACESAR